jgi:hypothetical protein
MDNARGVIGEVCYQDLVLAYDRALLARARRGAGWELVADSTTAARTGTVLNQRFRYTSPAMW